MDTQGMSGPVIEDSKENIYKPFQPSKLPIFSEMEREELKEIMREVLYDCYYY